MNGEQETDVTLFGDEGAEEDLYGAEDYEEDDVFGSGNGQLREIFGPDLQTVFDIIAGRRSRRPAEEEDPTEPTPSAAEEPQTSPEEAVAEADVPERLYLRYEHRALPASDAVLAAEAEWITQTLKSLCLRAPVPAERARVGEGAGLFDDFAFTDVFNEKRQRERYDLIFKRSGFDTDKPEDAGASGCMFFSPEKNIEQDITEKAELCLRMLLNERYDVPYICQHCSHILMPPLTRDVVWMIYALDVVWWRLNEFKRYAEHAGRRARGGGGEGAAGAAPAKPVKRRRTHLSPEQVFHKYFTQTGIRSAWTASFVDPAEVGRFIRESGHDFMDMDIDGSSIARVSRAPAAPAGLTAAAAAAESAFEGESGALRSQVRRWLEQLLKEREIALNPEQVVDMVLRFEGRQLALHPEFHETVRQWYVKEARVTTLTTMKGERVVDAGSPNWLACRLFNKPVAHLWSRSEMGVNEEDQRRLRETVDRWERQRVRLEIEDDANAHRHFGLLIEEAEKDELIHVLYHPLTELDLVPWRPPRHGLDAGSTLNDVGGLAGASLGGSTASGWAERARWENSEGEYPEEKRRLEFLVQQDVGKTNAFVQRVAEVMVDDKEPAAWVWFVNEVVKHAVLRELIPSIRLELKEKIIKESQRYVDLQCRQRLLLQLSMNYKLAHEQHIFPDFSAMAKAEVDDMVDVLVEGSKKPEDPNPPEDLGPVTTQPLIYSLVIEPDGDCAKSAPVHLVMANRQGLLVKTLTYPSLLEYVLGDPEAPKPRDLENLLLSLRTRPNVVAVPLINALSLDLFNYIKALSDTRVRYPKNSWRTVFVPASVALLASSKDSKAGGNGQGASAQGLSTAIGLSTIRYTANPVYETAYLWEEGEKNPLLSLPLHYLQHKIPVEQRLETLRECLTIAINAIGIYPNRLRVLHHLAPCLQFVSGLGPVKARRLIKELQQPLAARETLMGLGIGKHVFVSCASFFRIPATDDLFNDRYADLDPLDDTRIHPIEEYSTAKKMLRDAQDDPTEQQRSARRSSDYDSAQYDPKQLEITLEDLDLEAYAYILGQGGRPRMLPHLEMLKNETIRPFVDPRLLVENLTPAALLRTVMADETKCRPTALLQVLVESNTQLLVIPANLYATVIDFAHPDAARVSKGQILRARLSRLDEHDLAIVCAHTSREIGEIFKRAGAQLCHDPNTLSPLLQDDIEMARQNKGRRQIQGEQHVRKVQHPCVSNLGHRELLITLSRQAASAGASLSVSQKCRFRIGHQKNNLILYIAVHPQPFRFKAIPIEEADVPNDGRSVGRQLIINSVGSYSSLNEIIARPCTAFLTFVNDVVKHEKFKSGTPTELGNSLTPLSPGKVEWGICFDSNSDMHQLTERFCIITTSISSRTGAKRVTKDLMQVTAQGFKVWTQPNNTLQSMLSWYKTKGFPNRESYKAEFERQKHHS
ncbi:hypothetical protein GNI_008880 [Gregarina niphandrodes]|uniref:Transcription elongation factor SPT6 n=1 Tax=Gregarina niphandrodes TaxID=110365 RepID=A0A023BCY3_GRENI|nr:hypothetical protein GNI_008880 [Gregarina niphandrodes]EZG86954.1 hypothetical protein GNI_008880 [Gregarina niphandrodes]|eukprot:XP_011128729.1 hypothetical protein GNI_008880 [Gregarina niphandrodes]